MKKQLPNTGKKENTLLLKSLQKMNEQQTIAELVETLQTRLEKRQFKDAVHKIKLMTTLETVQRMLNGQLHKINIFGSWKT